MRSDSARSEDVAAFELDGATLADLQAGLAEGKFTAHSLAQKYLSRIEQNRPQGPKINSIIEINPDALALPRTSTRNAKHPRLAARFTASRF